MRTHQQQKYPAACPSAKSLPLFVQSLGQKPKHNAQQHKSLAWEGLIESRRANAASLGMKHATQGAQKGQSCPS